MKKLPLSLCFIVLGAAAMPAFADNPPVDFDLAQKSGTITILPGTTQVRLVHTKTTPGKTYRDDKNKAFTRPAPSTPAATDPCSTETLATKIDPVAADPALTELDLAKAIDSAVKGCQGNEQALRQFATDRTAIPIDPVALDAGKSATITINDPGKAPWRFTLRESHVDLDLTKPSGVLFVPPGQVIVRLVNALPGKEYHRLMPDGPPKQPAAVLNAGTCTGIDEALKTATTEKDGADKVVAAAASKNCTAAEKAAIAEKQTILFDTVTVGAGESKVIKAERVDKTESWAFSISAEVTKAGAGAATDGNSAGAASEENKDVTELKKLVTKATIAGLQPTTDVTCKAGDDICPTVFVSASAQSLITITDVATRYPSGKVIVRLTAGETYPTGDPVFVEKEFAIAPAEIVISLAQDRMFNPSYGSMRGGAANMRCTLEGASRKLIEVTGPKAGEHAWKNTKGAPCAAAAQAEPDDFAIHFVTQGRSRLLAVVLVDKDGKEHAINTTIVYQHWFVDTGGFLTISNVTDEELVTTTASNGDVTVKKKRNKDRLTPGTGAVLDFHPANYPKWTVVQFGIATNQDRQVSYYLGSGYRLLEIGSNALATFAAGVSAVPSLRFPEASVNIVYPAADPALKGKAVYRFGAYLSFSFGFRFGDTPAAAAPSTPTEAKPPGQ